MTTPGPDPSPIGRRLGSFTIQALLGAGGMGEVYRARDTAPGRDVAIKILPAVWLLDPDRRARFDREARGASPAAGAPRVITVLLGWFEDLKARVR